MKRRSDGRWVKKIALPSGKTKYFYSTAKTEREAVKDFNLQMMQYEKKEEKGKSFVAVADKWNTEYRQHISDINYRKNTKAAYERIIDYFSDNTNIRDITAPDVNMFIKKLTAQNFYKKTIANHKSVMNMIFSFAVLNGYASHNPVSDIRLPNNLPKNPRQLPTSDEIKEVSSHHNGFDLLPFFLLYTGLRKSEALAITDKSIDFDNKLIKIRNHVIHDNNKPVFEPVLKTEAAARDVILLDRLAAVIPKNFSGFLFSMNGDGKEPLTSKAFQKRWENYCKKYNLNITAHQLRHGYATMLFEAGIDMKDAQELMGHSDINLTRQVYTHIRNERKTETAKKLNDFNF